MQRNRLLAVGLAAALVLGSAATPVLAAGNGKAAKEKPAKKAKPAKKSHFAVSGGGATTDGSFSIQARLRKPSKAHFNFTSADETFKVRCKSGWKDAPQTEPVLTAYPRTMDVTFKDCKITGQANRMDLEVTVIDNGQPTETQVAKDAVSFTAPGGATWGGDLVEGNVKIRNKK